MFRLTEIADVGAMELFPFVGPEHPFYSYIARLRAEVSRQPLWRETMHRTSPAAVRTLMRARRLPRGEWGLKWVSVSFQSRDAWTSRFDALTLFYSAKTQRIEAYEFPHDPCLRTASSFFGDAMVLSKHAVPFFRQGCVKAEEDATDPPATRKGRTRRRIRCGSRSPRPSDQAPSRSEREVPERRS